MDETNDMIKEETTIKGKRVMLNTTHKNDNTTVNCIYKNTHVVGIQKYPLFSII